MDEDTQATDPGRTKPPYMSFQTFWNFIGDLGKKPLPPQIDRSMMDSKSGTDQANLTGALKTFGLIAEDLTVDPRLDVLVHADEDGKKKLLREIVEAFYPDAMRVSASNGTEKMLQDSFRDWFGLDAADTRRKSMTFFLHAARTAGIPLSPNFPQIRAGGIASTGKARKPATRRPKPPTEDSAPGRTTNLSAGETKVVDFGSAGKVSINVNVKWLDLPADAMGKLRALIDQLDALGATTTAGGVDEEVDGM